MSFFVLSKGDLLRLLACLLLGTLFGTAVTNVVTGHHLDQLMLENNELTQQLAEEQARIKQFEQVHSWTPIVRKVQLNLTCSAEKHTVQELEKKIRTLITGLIGLKIQQVDTRILRDILHGRIIPVGDETFELQLETLIVAEEVIFIVKAGTRPKKALEDE